MASDKIGNLHYELDLEDKGLKKGLQTASNEVGGFEKRLKAAEAGSQIFAGALAGMTAAAVAFGVKSVRAFQESDTVARKLEKLIMNQEAGTLQQVEALKQQAKAIQNVGVVTDDAVIAAQAQLATFDFTSEAIAEVIPGFIDMAVAEKGVNIGMDDMKDLANGLGKAMQGNTELFTKQGFVITDHQKKVLENGNEMERAAMIAEILGGTYKGMNAAMRDTFEGQMVVATNNIGDFQEAVGELIKNSLSPLLVKFNEWTDAMGGPEGIMKRITEDIVPKLRDNLPIITGIIIGGLTPAFVGLAGSIWATMGPLIPFMVAGAAIALVVQKLVEHMGGWEVVMLRLAPLFDTLKTAFQILIDVARGWDPAALMDEETFNRWSGFIGVVQAMRDAIVTFVQTVWNWVTSSLVPALQTFWQWVQNLWDKVKAFADLAGSVLLPVLQSVWEQIQNQLLPVLRDFWEKHGEAILKLLKAAGIAFGVVVAIIMGTVVVAILALLAAVKLLISWFSNMLQVASVVFSAIKYVVQTNFDRIKAIFNALGFTAANTWSALKEGASIAFGAIVGFIQKIIDKFRELKQKSKDFLASLPGGGFISGLIPGFAGGVSNFGGGFAVVGEQGPELVHLPRGADVIPNDQSMKMMQSAPAGNTYITINTEGVLARTRNELADFIIDGLRAADDRLRASGKETILKA